MHYADAKRKGDVAGGNMPTGSFSHAAPGERLNKRRRGQVFGAPILKRVERDLVPVRNHL